MSQGQPGLNTLKSVVAVVTGGGSGIGRAVALGLLARGARVTALGRRKEKLDDLVAGNPGAQVLGLACDVRDEAAVKSAFGAVRERFGPVQVLVNNAGIGIPTPDLAAADVASFDAMFDTNVRGSFLCAREALADMKAAGRGHIVNVVSAAGHKTNPIAPLYCASKYAQRGFSSGLADQALAFGVRVSEVSPGAVDSEYWGNRAVPREKYLHVEQVAAAILWVLEQPPEVVIHSVQLESLAIFRK